MPSAFSYPAASIGVAGQIPTYNNNNMLSSIIGAGGSMLGSLISGLFANHNTNKANAANLKIAQMNNEFNKAMFDQQIQYNWDMFNATNAYNTPEQQRQRLEQAGLNPYLILDGGNAGIAQGGNSVSPPTAQSVEVQPYIPNFQGISDAFMQLAQMEYLAEEQKGKARLANAQATGVETQNDFIRTMLENELLQRKENYRGSKLQNDFNQQVFWSDVATHEAQAEIAKNEQDLSMTKQAAAVLDMNLAKKRYVLDQKIGASVITKNVSDAAFSAQGVKNLAEQLNGLVFDNAGKALDYEQRRDLAQDLIDTMRAELGVRRENAKNAPYQNKWFNTFSHHFNKTFQFLNTMNDIWNFGHGGSTGRDALKYGLGM